METTANDSISAGSSEPLTLSETRRLIAEITRRVRSHPGVRQGVSVRGALAFEAVSGGMAELGGGLTRECLHKAALITAPPRIATAEGFDAVSIVNAITEEVLYGISADEPYEATDVSLAGLSAEEMRKKLAEMGQSSVVKRVTEQNQLPKVMPNQRQKMGKRLENANSAEKGHALRRSFSDRALEYLLQQLEHKLQAGEMTAAEFKQEKERLLSRFRADAGNPQFFSSGSEMASTIMEMIDAQDKQWNPEVSFDTMHIYYHIKANNAGPDLSPVKKDYHALKWLMDDLERQGVLRTADRSSGFVLTGLSLDMLLKYLTRDNDTRRNFGLRQAGRAQSWERSDETRRYRSGDSFRDISVRHTLKELARQKKTLSDVRARDIRVRLKQLRRSQSDIVLCIDTSGSMGFHQKLMYARLAAAGLVQSSIAAGDRVGLVAFDDCGQVTLPLMGKDNMDTLLNYIAALSPRGNTNISDGIKTAKESLSRGHSHNQKRIILITDGQPNVISEKAFDRLKLLRERDLTEEACLAETKAARTLGIQVSVLHIANRGETSDMFVRKIAKAGKGRVRRLDGPEDLKFDRIGAL